MLRELIPFSQVYLDEPTTGMDPINRRHVWDVVRNSNELPLKYTRWIFSMIETSDSQVEAAKQDRSVILTTHSMEEADILGDRIGIMAKGRLRCIGNSVRLKTRFGEGYKVSVSCGDKMRPDSEQSVRVKQFFKEQLGVSVSEETKAYMHFSVPSNSDELMAKFFSDLEAHQQEFGIVDVQLSMSTLEDVFLKVATASELEDAKMNQKTIVVTLQSGENVGVLVGCEDQLTSPAGVTFVVRWGTDEDGKLIPIETKEIEMEQKQVMVTCPADVGPGHSMNVDYEGKSYAVEVPANVTGGQQFMVTIQVPKADGRVLQHDVSESLYQITQEEVQARVKKLHTPFIGQANALFRKNLSFQWKRRTTNCCLVAVPLFVLALVFAIQALLELLFLGQGVVRCPYCGPADDDYGRLYCNKASSCVDFFFSNSSRQEYKNLFGVDVVAQCQAIAGLGPLGKNDPSYCYGGGNITCFQVQWATGSQFAFCPFKAGTVPTQPLFGSVPTPYVRSNSPVLLTSDASSRDFAFKVGNKSAPSKNTIAPKVLGAMRETNRQFFSLFAAIPWMGCSASNASSSVQQSMCKLLQHGSDSKDVCCVDLTGNSTTSGASYMGLADWAQGSFVGELKSGVNYWSDMPNVHSDALYAAFMTTCTLTSDRGACNKQIMTTWQGSPLPAGKFGVRFGTGRGKYLSGPSGLQHALLTQGASPQLKNLVSADFLSSVPSQESFTCVVPGFPAGSKLNNKIPDSKCVNLEEGVAIVAQTQQLNQALHPIYSNEKGEVPECSQLGTCTFQGINDPVIGQYSSDTPNRWAQMCDFYTVDFAKILNDLEKQCNAERGCPAAGQCPLAIGASACVSTQQKLKEYLSSIPCMCRWVYFTRQLVSATYFPSGQAANIFMQLPRQYDCKTNPDSSEDCTPDAPSPFEKPGALPQSGCWRKHYHPFSIPEMQFVTPIWPPRDFYSENALTPSTDSWWNRQHVLSPSEKSKYDSDHRDDRPRTCESDEDCWLEVAESKGAFAFAALNCSDLEQASCFIQRMGNLTGFDVGCVSTNPTFKGDISEINRATYNGQFSQYGSKLSAEEYMGGYNLHNSAPGLLNVTVLYNDTTQVMAQYDPNPTPHSIRISQPLSAIVNSFLNVDASGFVGAMMGTKEVTTVNVVFFLALQARLTWILLCLCRCRKSPRF